MPREVGGAWFLSPSLWPGIIFHKAFGFLVSTITEKPLGHHRMVDILLITIVRCIVSLLTIPKYRYSCNKKQSQENEFNHPYSWEEVIV